MVDSATGGFLSPQASPAPLDGLDLNNFLQVMMAALTGLDGTLVRPAFQPEPGNVPDAGTAWMAFRYTSKPVDVFPAIIHHPDGQGYDEFQRHEELHVLCSFYDLGTNGLADYYCSLLRDNIMVPQNMEYLTSVGMGLTVVGDKQVVPVLLASRWQYRVDLPIIIRRAVQRIYPVLNTLQAVGTLATDTGVSVNLVSIP
jgi:hypothetical protein